MRFLKEAGTSCSTPYRRKDSIESTFDCDAVLMATGKRPDTSHVNLDARCQTITSNIYAVGDFIGGYMLAHAAATQGRVAAPKLLGHASDYDQDRDCGVTFSRPQAPFAARRRS